MFINGPVFTEHIGNLRKDLTQHLALAPPLEPAMDGFVIGITLGQQVPLRTGVQYPKHRLQHRPGGNGLTPRPGIRDVLFGEMVSNPFPLVATQAEHDGGYTYGYSCCQAF